MQQWRHASEKKTPASMELDVKEVNKLCGPSRPVDNPWLNLPVKMCLACATDSHHEDRDSPPGQSWPLAWSNKIEECLRGDYCYRCTKTKLKFYEGSWEGDGTSHKYRRRHALLQVEVGQREW